MNRNNERKVAAYRKVQR